MNSIYQKLVDAHCPHLKSDLDRFLAGGNIHFVSLLTRQLKATSNRLHTRSQLLRELLGKECPTTLPEPLPSLRLALLLPKKLTSKEKALGRTLLSLSDEIQFNQAEYNHLYRKIKQCQ
jgi:hypothetical protein